MAAKLNIKTHRTARNTVFFLSMITPYYSFALFTDLTMAWTTSGERPYVSPVDQRRQEVHYGWLLSGSDIVPVAGLCALLYDPQLCLLPGLYVGPDGG